MSNSTSSGVSLASRANLRSRTSTPDRSACSRFGIQLRELLMIN